MACDIPKIAIFGYLNNVELIPGPLETPQIGLFSKLCGQNMVLWCALFEKSGEQDCEALCESLLERAAGDFQKSGFHE